ESSDPLRAAVVLAVNTAPAGHAEHRRPDCAVSQADPVPILVTGQIRRRPGAAQPAPYQGRGGERSP
ncbi:MAG: hypothetical protein ACXWZL_12390, partial [Mycobacterium sp.]